MRVLKRIGKAVHKSVAFDSRKYFGKKALKNRSYLSFLRCRDGHSLQNALKTVNLKDKC